MHVTVGKLTMPWHDKYLKVTQCGMNLGNCKPSAAVSQSVTINANMAARQQPAISTKHRVIFPAFVKNSLRKKEKKKCFMSGWTCQVGAVGVGCLFVFFFNSFLVAKITLKTQFFFKSDIFCRKILGKYFDLFS